MLTMHICGWREEKLISVRRALMTARINVKVSRVPELQDPLTILAPMLRVRPEIQDFCRFGGAWRAVHQQEQQGWVAFHIVTKGACSIERTGQPGVMLEAGDVLLLPHGDAHVVYGGGPNPEFRDVVVTYRDYIRVKETQGAPVETELICGRLHLETTSENLLLRTLPHVIVLRLGGMSSFSSLVTMIREELTLDRGGAAAITRDLASGLFMMLLRHHLETEPPANGLLALLSARETGRAVTAMLNEPAKNWALDELASVAMVSRATLVRAFRRLSGIPPLAFLTEVRLGIARNRIAQTSDGLGQIAVDAGYQSEAALSRALQRRFAMRPGAMRKLAEDEGGPD
ncbi:AraC family transcriptional regulator [Sphingomonas sp. PAMC 26605]|uniref:AraC family transcriptional regulator n=1 Tax=Sphingomonas sp. PAMC 26605 TaxID=1112214 RepID=UPI001E3BEE7D|nr:AraC family transcriptional regulator [Sphingomonas sp. PAMC 26605]